MVHSEPSNIVAAKSGGHDIAYEYEDTKSRHLVAPGTGVIKG
jgi:hypothetical protein